jgi:hypothetical protein
MSLDKAIEHGKEHRKPYYGSKRFDRTCRNNGTCGWCEGNRKYSNKKRELITDEKLEEFYTEKLLSKNPKTDNGLKKSQKGMVAIIEENGVLKCIDGLYAKNEVQGSLLKPVYKNGKLLRETTLEEIRNICLN